MKLGTKSQKIIEIGGPNLQKKENREIKVAFKPKY
jgi:hypothetical protein